MKVAILYRRLYEFDGTALSIGGIQTYLLCLAQLVIDSGWEPVIFQLAGAEFEREVGQVKIVGKSGISLDSSACAVGSFLTKHAESWIAGADAIIIHGSDFYFVDSSIKSIAIQHGVTWDLPAEGAPSAPGKGGSAGRLLEKFRNSRFNQARRTWLSLGSEECKRQSAIRFMVCVDYNFINVTKSQGRPLRARTWVIPNFAEVIAPDKIASREQKPASTRILFARRFVWYRGTRLAAPVFARLLKACPDVCITFAGEGPDENWLREFFSYTDRVTFLKYGHEESADILLSHDISVIPSLGSEGTSLSAIEAMAAHCTVVATCVGGLSNIIIDGYNGRLVMPVEEDLYEALHQVANNAGVRSRLAERAYDSVNSAFSQDIWREKWHEVLLHVSRS